MFADRIATTTVLLLTLLAIAAASKGLAAVSGSAAVTATIDVKDYGAVGNGQADDTAAIQKALDAGVGKQVIVPPGRYNVRPLVERTATTLNLDPQATLVLAPGSNANLVTITAPGASVTGSGTLDGNGTAQTRGAGLSIGGAKGVTLRGIRIVNTAQSGIYAANVADLSISGVSVSATGYVGIFAESTWGTITNLAIENSRVDRSSSGSSIVEGGIVVHRTGPASTVSGVRISGNTVLMPKGPTNDVVAIETYGGVQGVVIQDNTTTGGAIGISLAQTTNGSVIHNSVATATLYGIRLAASRAINVATNTVRCDVNTARGIVLDNTAPTGNTVSNNTISGCVASAIELNTGSNGSNITNNQISQTQNSTAAVSGSAAVTATIDVKDYGAVGNGQADDTAAIQKALDAGVGKQVIVPPGRYNVRPLVERTATTLNLDPQATLVLAPGSNANLVTITAPGASVTGSGTLDGNGTAQTRGAGLSIGGAKGVTLRGIRIVNTAQSGIYAANVADLSISGVSVSATGYVGIFAESTWGTITNLAIENSRVDRSSSGSSIVEGGIVVHRTGPASTVSGVRISGNTVLMPKGPTNDVVAIETYGGVQGVVIQDNTTTGGAIGISLAQTTNGSVIHNSVATATLYGIELAASQTNTVSANTIDCGARTTVGIVLDNTAPTGNTVSNNTISGCVASAIELNTGSNGSNITNNQISQTEGDAIMILRTTGVTVTGNRIAGGARAATAIVIANSSNVDITRNELSNFQRYGIWLYGTSPTIPLNQIRITFNTFSKMSQAYGVQLTGGGTLGTLIYSDNSVG